MEEAEIHKTDGFEYELIPVGPIRKLEKRLEVLERSVVNQETLAQMFEIVRTNQMVVDEIVKINTNMMERVAQLTGSVASLTERMNDFLSRIEVEELPAVKELKGMSDADERLKKLENRLNTLILSMAPKARRPARDLNSLASLPMPAAVPV
jgi:uncharacterized coiled-coil protein SlyX